MDNPNPPQSAESTEKTKQIIPEVLTLAIRNKKDLHAHYMPFITNGGIFISTEKKFHLGDSVGMLIRFIDRGKKLILTGTVVWMSPQSDKQKPDNQTVSSNGVGLQFTGKDQYKVKKAIEAYLGNLAGRPSLNQVY